MPIQDERITKAIDLFQEAWMLLDNLSELRKRLPAANLSNTGGLPADWNAERSADCVQKLEAYVQAGLQLVATDLDIRKEFEIRAALLQPSRKFGLTGQAWLEQRDQQMGNDDPKA
jgi:hypothetical protein